MKRPFMCQLGNTLLKEDKAAWPSQSKQHRDNVLSNSGSSAVSLSGRKRGPPPPSLLLPTNWKTNSEQPARSTDLHAWAPWRDIVFPSALAGFSLSMKALWITLHIVKGIWALNLGFLIPSAGMFLFHLKVFYFFLFYSNYTIARRSPEKVELI